MLRWETRSQREGSADLSTFEAWTHKLYLICEESRVTHDILINLSYRYFCLPILLTGSVAWPQVLHLQLHLQTHWERWEGHGTVNALLAHCSETFVALSHVKLFSCFWSYKSLKSDQATRLFFFFSETKAERKWCTNNIMHRRGWGLGTRLQNADTCVSREPSLGWWSHWV